MKKLTNILHYLDIIALAVVWMLQVASLLASLACIAYAISLIGNNPFNALEPMAPAFGFILIAWMTDAYAESGYKSPRDRGEGPQN